MRIHTSAPYRVLSDAARDLGIELRASKHASRTHAHAFEVSLRGHSRRRPNHYDGEGSYAATWDEWGVFLARVFYADPTTRCGGAKHPVYRNRGHFDARTLWRFESLTMPDDAHGDHTFRFAGVPRERECTKCSARQRWDI